VARDSSANDFAEDTTFNDHLEVLFPAGNQWPEWDVHHHYDNSRVSVYTVLHHVEPRDKKLRTGKMPVMINLDKTTTLKQIITNPEYIVPGVPVFWIVSPEYKDAFVNLPLETLTHGY